MYSTQRRRFNAANNDVVLTTCGLEESSKLHHLTGVGRFGFEIGPVPFKSSRPIDPDQLPLQR